jgi:murein DD-endopeptidase MepM/ murein hydrolase activator NlpD
MRRRKTDLRGWTTSRRRRTGARFVLLLFTLSVLGGLFTTATPSVTSADELDDAYARQQQLQRQIAKQKASISSLAETQASLSRRISDTKSSLAAINANLIAVRTQIVTMVVDVARSQSAVDELTATAARLDAELELIEAEEAEKRADLVASKEMLAARIRDAYDTDRTSMFETFLSSDDFTDVLTEVGYQMDFAEQDKILADQIVEDQKVLDVLHQNVTDARAQTAELEVLAAKARKVLDRQLAELRSAQQALLRLERQTQKLLDEQKAAYERMLAEKAELQRKLEASHEAEKKLEQLINRLVREMFKDGGIPSEYNGTFTWPMEGAVTQEFGCTGFSWEPPLGSCNHFHRGIDIAGPMYTPIRAAGHGKVVFVGKSPWDPAWIVIIAHSQHLVSWYGHIDNRSHPPKVKEGQYVAKGQVIAYNGLTGWTTGPHVHWAVQMDETWVNPRLFLPR